MQDHSSVVIETGDYFVVSRGEPVHVDGRKPIRYDCQFEGVVFYAMEVCGTFVAAKVCYPHKLQGRTLSLNVAPLETMTVSPKYANDLEESEPPTVQESTVPSVPIDVHHAMVQDLIEVVHTMSQGFPCQLCMCGNDDDDDDDEGNDNDSHDSGSGPGPGPRPNLERFSGNN